MAPIGNYKPHDNEPNPVLYVPSESDSDPSSLDSSLSESSDSSDDGYYKQRRRAKKDKNKRRSKTCFDEPIRKYTNLAAKLLTSAYKSKVFRFKLNKYPLQRRVYFIPFMNSLKIVLSNFSETYVLLMGY